MQRQILDSLDCWSWIATHCMYNAALDSPVAFVHNDGGSSLISLSFSPETSLCTIVFLITTHHESVHVTCVPNTLIRSCPAIRCVRSWLVVRSSSIVYSILCDAFLIRNPGSIGWIFNNSDVIIVKLSVPIAFVYDCVADVITNIPFQHESCLYAVPFTGTSLYLDSSPLVPVRHSACTV